LRVGFIAKRLPLKSLIYIVANKCLGAIRDLVRTREFHPFVITTDDGNARPVQQVEQIGVGDNNIVLIGTDHLIEIIPGTHVSSVAVGSPADVSLIKRGIKLDGSITREPKCLI
jgi:hypothetical protein